MISYGRAPVFYPCHTEGLRCDQEVEVLLVEGDSAAKSVNQVRDPSWQAVLALQGKPLNASRASWRTLSGNAVVQRIADCLIGRRPPHGAYHRDWLMRAGQPEFCRFDRVVILMDPDADGIHCGVLTLGILLKLASPLFQQDRVAVVRPPMFEIRWRDSEGQSQRHPASTPAHADTVEEHLESHGITSIQKVRHRGLASLDSGCLKQWCVRPQSRQAEAMTLTDAEQAVAAFGHHRP